MPINSIVRTVDNKTPYNPIKLTNIKFSAKFDKAVTSGLNLSLCQIPAASLYKFNNEFISYTKKYITNCAHRQIDFVHIMCIMKYRKTSERGVLMPKFSDRFKQLRTERRLSQQNLADQLGFSKSSVNMYERGEREPGLESMETIADYFNVDLDYLMGRSDIPNRNEWLKSINKSVVVEPSQPQVKFDNIIPISTKRFPLLGDIACGKPIMANEEKELYAFFYPFSSLRSLLYLIDSKALDAADPAG